MDGSILAFVDEWKSGDRTKARELAREYVDKHSARLAPLLEPLHRDDIVKLIDAYREHERHVDVAVAEMWLLTKYDPQKISGVLGVGGGPAVRAVEELLHLTPTED